MLNERPASDHNTHWLIVFFIDFLLARLVFNGLSRWLNKIGLGNLPGDFSFRIGSRHYLIPTTSSLVLRLLAIGAFT